MKNFTLIIMAAILGLATLQTEAQGYDNYNPGSSPVMGGWITLLAKNGMTYYRPFGDVTMNYATSVGGGTYTSSYSPSCSDNNVVTIPNVRNYVRADTQQYFNQVYESSYWASAPNVTVCVKTDTF